jgi:hypothetical protein
MKPLPKKTKWAYFFLLNDHIHYMLWHMNFFVWVVPYISTFNLNLKFVIDLQQVSCFLGTPVSSTNKTDHHDITEMLLKVVLSTIKQTTPIV